MVPSSTSPNQPLAEPLAKFPLAVREAHRRFLEQGDAASLDVVVLAIVRHHQPEHIRAHTAPTPPNSARLVGDLGFDSLALAEIVFYIEDLYRIAISNEELADIATIGELRAFIRVKVGRTRTLPN